MLEGQGDSAPILKAEASNDQFGFHPTRYVDPVEHVEFICGICHGIFRNPFVTECCGQTYCSFCIEQWLTSAETCPNDRSPLTVSGLKGTSKAFKSLLSNLKINCDFQSEGCDTKVKLAELDSHSKICDYRPNSKCERCGIQKEKDSNHDCIESLLNANKALIDEQVEHIELIKELNDKSEKDIEDVRESSRRQIRKFKDYFIEEISSLHNKVVRASVRLEELICDRIDPNDHSDYFETYNSSDGWDRSDPFDRFNNTERRDQWDRSEHFERHYSPDRWDRSDHFDRFNNTQRRDQWDRSDHFERYNSPERWDHSDRFE